MADDKKMSAAPSSGADEKLNKARAEFEKYRNRMSGRMGEPMASPLGPGRPILGGKFPGAYVPGTMPFPFGAPGPMPPQGLPSAFAGSGPLFENVGKMLQMGMAFATAVFAGGMQALQGFSGAPMSAKPCSCHSQSMPMPHGGECGCQHEDSCHGDYHDSCRGSCACDCECCCNPGVSNCECRC